MEKHLLFNNASIAKESNNNIILQGNEINNLVFCNNSSDLIRCMGEIGQYDIVQKIIQEALSTASQAHPLKPYFTAQYNNELKRLVSTPETDDALEKFPKNIKGSFLIDYKQYPYMDKSENPWEYAYRTQTQIELQTTEYQEYLGNEKDPYPLVKYSDGMRLTIEAPEFPEAVNATVSSGDISVPILLRRKPCMEFGKMMFGTTINECGFDMIITSYQNFQKTDIKIIKNFNSPLNVQLQREKLISNIHKTKHISINIGNVSLLDATFTEDDLSADIFAAAPFMIQHLENLDTIETNTGCSFDISSGNIDENEYKVAYILALSFQGKYYREKVDFDDEIRCDYDRIPTEIFDNPNMKSEIVMERKELEIILRNQTFFVEKYTLAYTHSKINNLPSVVKNCRKKRKNILITMRPISGEDFFYKYYKFEGVKYINTSKVD